MEMEKKKKEKPPVKRRLSLKLKSPSKRFKTLSDEEFKSVSVQHLPKNTEYATRWCLTNYETRRKARNSKQGSEKDIVPDNLFDVSPDVIDKWLAYFVAETRNSEGNRYPP